MKHLVFVTLLTCLGLSDALRAAPGDVDLTFDPGSGVNGPVYSVIGQTDGKVIIGGGFSTVRGALRNGIARLNADGTVDNTFDPGSGADNAVMCLAAQTDGKLLLGGSFSSVNGTNRNRIARLNPDGSLDDTFNPGFWVDNVVYTVAVQPDGKILLGGDGIYGVVRLRSNGTYDSGFELAFEDDVSRIASIALQPDGRIVVGGTFGTLKGTNWNNVARLNTNGTPDSAFSPGAGPNFGVNSVAVQTDGKLLIGGDFTTVNGTNRIRIARLNANGSLDAAFDPGTGADKTVRSIAAHVDGMVLVGGEFSSLRGTSRQGIGRLNSNGSLDWFNGGLVPSNQVYSLVVQTDNKVLLGGGYGVLGDPDWKALVRLHSNGNPDPAFNAHTGANRSISRIAVQPDGKVLLAGMFATINRTNRPGVARLNANGSLDSTFDPGSGAGGVDPADASYRLVNDVAVQPDGKVVVAGAFTTMNGISRKYVARLEANGSLDNTFDPVWDSTWGPNGPVNAIALQLDGKLLVAGGVIGGLLRRSTDGIVDGTFQPGSGATSGLVNCLAVQPDGKIVIGGSFAAFNGTNRHGIARLHPNGSLDATFDPGPGVYSDSVYCVALQPDGKVLLGGNFNFVNGGNLRKIARLNSNGSLDPTFNPGTGANDYVFSVATQPDGKILVAGMFSAFNGITRNRIARLNADGSLDPTFDPGSGPSGGNYNRVHSVVMQTDGKILAGGDFTIFNGTARSHAVRLMGDPILNIQQSGDHLVLRWTHDTFSLQSAAAVTGTYTNVPGAISPYTNTIIGSQRYFRLKSNY